MSYTIIFKDNRYWVVLREKDEQGKWHQRWILLSSTSKRTAKLEAVDKITEYNEEKERSTIPSHSLSWLIREYIEHTTLTPKTRQNYMSILETHIDPYFSGKKFSELTANDFSIYYKNKTEKSNLSPNSVIKHHQLIHAAYEYAISGDMMDKNPSDRAKKPRKIRREPDAYSLEDYQRLFEAAKKTKIFPEIVLAMVYGLRRSELLGLRWSCIDWSKRIIEVSLSVTRVNNEWFFNEAMKTNGSKRKLSISEPIADFLNSLYEKQKKMKELLGDFYNKDFEDFICVDSVGDLMTPDYITNTFTKLVKSNGLPKLTFHGLRHSFISILIDAGYNPKAVQTASGHDVLTTTMNYAKAFDPVQTQMIDYISAFLKTDNS